MLSRPRCPIVAAVYFSNYLTIGLALSPLAQYWLLRRSEHNRTEPNMFNISTRRIGGIRFFKIGRFCFSFCLTQQYRAL